MSCRRYVEERFSGDGVRARPVTIATRVVQQRSFAFDERAPPAVVDSSAHAFLILLRRSPRNTLAADRCRSYASYRRLCSRVFIFIRSSVVGTLRTNNATGKPNGHRDHDGVVVIGSPKIRGHRGWLVTDVRAPCRTSRDDGRLVRVTGRRDVRSRVWRAEETRVPAPAGRRARHGPEQQEPSRRGRHGGQEETRSSREI